ncbi:glycoside hydrolase family 140 protein [Pontibacter chitinilyticus]|uniref:glycoside hydrolase family 140 protein n=1 Tax=Pontibacter chitinilyticus TaxID=2674989 RepID=UPI00321B72D5
MKMILTAFLSSLTVYTSVFSQQLPVLKVSNNKHYIVTDANKPFFWLGGTAWELFHRLTKEEAKTYLEDRAGKGFTVIQAVILAELDGLKTPNVYGDVPLLNNDPTRLNEKYFKHVDAVIKQAGQLGLYMGLLPTWGDKFNKAWGEGPEIFTPQNAEIYGELLAKRYKTQRNIIWILGGDRWPDNEEDREIIRAMARGIRKVDTEHLVSYHPSGAKKATDFFNEAWLDVDMLQTGHDRQAKEYAFVQASRAVEPARPVINGEPRYEDHPDRFRPEIYGWMDASDVRTSAYWTMLSGAAGYTYGCHDIWQMFSNKVTPVNGARTSWKEALQLPGSTQVKYMKALLTAFPWQDMAQDQSVILNANPQDSSYIVGAIGKNHNFILAYTPMGKPIKADLSKLNTDAVQAFWFNPRDGHSKKIGEYKATEKPEFKPWSVGRGSDFVLVLLAANTGYKLPV